MKEEMGDGSAGGGGGGGSGGGGLELKQQLAQNEKLRQTLVNMRDLMAHEKNVAMKMTKDLEEKTAENAKLAKQNSTLTTQNEELEGTISELQEQVIGNVLLSKKHWFLNAYHARLTLPSVRRRWWRT